MSEMDVQAFEANFNRWWKEERGKGLERADAFERYAADQILKTYDPADEDVEAGILGGGDDGGADAMYLYIDGQPITEETELPDSSRDFDVHIVQAKYESSFKETPVQKLQSFAEDLLNFKKDPQDIDDLNSKAKDAIANFRRCKQHVIGSVKTINVTFHYACKASDVPVGNNKVLHRAKNLTGYVQEILGQMGRVEFVPWAAGKLRDSQLSQPRTRVTIPCVNSFTTKDKSAVCLVKLTDFAQLILSTKDGHLQTRFLEPNVRDYQGKGNVANTAIRNTLESPNADEDFWWLNNGITILASRCAIVGDEAVIDDPEIVNGLQTSHEVFNWYTGRMGISDDRLILLRILKTPDDPNTRARIIKATNSQTTVSAFTLLSTEPIQQVIDDTLRSYELFYDRKKGRCKREKRPIKQVVSMRVMAQAVMAIVLHEPDQARARPESFIKRNDTNPRLVFPPDSDGEVYAACILIDRAVNGYLSGLRDRDTARNIRYYVDLCVASIVTNCTVPGPLQLKAALPDIMKLGDEVLAEAVSLVKPIYVEQGGTDQAAKKDTMTTAVLMMLKDRIPAQDGGPTQTVKAKGTRGQPTGAKATGPKAPADRG